MRLVEPQFWWAPPGRAGLKAACLTPLAAGYGWLAAARMARSMARPGVRAEVPVICVGNFTLGGAGKTPTAIAIARLLADAGEKPALLSRGYGGALRGPVRVDPLNHRAADIGDEPLLLARAAMTVVARDRAAGARMACDAGATVIVMDDGLQNPSLEQDIAIAVVEGGRGIGNAKVFPAGPLRAPLAAQLGRAHALLVVGAGAASSAIIAASAERGLRIFHGALEPDRSAVTALLRHKILAFAGIGNPEKFFSTLAAAGIDATVCRRFPDHYDYSARDARNLMADADRLGLELLTTEKDAARIAGVAALAALAARSKVLPVSLSVTDTAALRTFLLEGVRRRRA